MVKGAAKGAEFERSTGKTFSRWLTGDEDATQLIRSTSSGGWAHGKAAPEGWRQLGDLSPNGEAGAQFCQHFALECKTRKPDELDWWHVFTASKPTEGNLLGYWLQARESVAKHPEVVPLLVCTTLYKPLLVGSPTEVGLGVGEPYLECFLAGEAVRFVMLEQFLERAPEEYYEEVRAWRRRSGLGS